MEMFSCYLRLGGKLGLVGQPVTGLIFPTCRDTGWESERGKLTPSTLLSSSLFVPLLLPCHLPSIYTPLEKKQPYAWLPCECAVLHVYYGSTGGAKHSRPFSCFLVIGVGQRAAGGRDVLRKQESCDELQGCRRTLTVRGSFFIVSVPQCAA